MRDLLTWTSVVLIIGGIVAAMVGLIWYKGGNLLTFFGHDPRPERGLALAVAGLAAMLAGFGLVRLAE